MCSSCHLKNRTERQKWKAHFCTIKFFAGSFPIEGTRRSGTLVRVRSRIMIYEPQQSFILVYVSQRSKKTGRESDISSISDRWGRLLLLNNALVRRAGEKGAFLSDRLHFSIARGNRLGVAKTYSFIAPFRGNFAVRKSHFSSFFRLFLVPRSAKP